MIDDTTYDATSWDGVTSVAPSKNAVRDKLVNLEASLPATYQKIVAPPTGVAVTDTANINAALAAGGEVVLRAGTYTVTGLTISASHTHLRGAGMGVTTIQLAAGANDDVVYAGDNKADIEVSDLTIDGNKANNTSGRGLVFVIVMKAAVRRVRVTKTAGRGIYVYRGSDATVEQCECEGVGLNPSIDSTNSGIIALNTVGVRITGNLVTDTNDIAIAIFGGYTAVIGDNVVDTSNYIGIALGTGPGAGGGITIVNNKVSGCASNGIDTGSVSDVAVTGNVITDGAMSGIACDFAGSTGGRSIKHSVIGNIVSRCHTGITFTGHQTTADHGFTVVGNVISDLTNHGIALNGVHYGTISSNRVRNPGTIRSSIELPAIGSGVQHVSFTGNVLSGPAGSNAINLNNNTNNDNNIWVGNDLSGHVLQFVSDASVNDIRSNNLGVPATAFTRTYSTAFGLRAGAADVSTAPTYLTTFGTNALRSNTTGGYNSALGSYTLDANTTGNNNSAFGTNALRSNTTGNNNSAFGTDALRSNIGNNNIAFGTNALRSNTTGGYNSAFGSYALYTPGGLSANATTTALRQTAIGMETGQASATQRNDIVAIGYRALVDANDTVAIGSGAQALHANAVALGKGVVTTTSNQVMVGPNNIEITDTTKGLVLKSPDGTRYKIQVANGGALATVAA